MEPYMFSVRIRRRNVIYFFRQNRFSLFVDIWRKERTGLKKCTGWPIRDLTQGHGCGIDKQKVACLHNKMRTTRPITTKLVVISP